ncbi:MAG: SpoVR family protein, partial [Planctomycetota bacterium]
MMLPPELDRERLRIREIAEGYGLDFFETVFEMVPWGAMNAVAAYGGFPVRYPHWRFGMLYEQMVKGYAYGLQKIYELVINNDPCYAYLLNGNTVVDQKMIMAHVYAHCDFFKNNLWFAPTNRHMVDELASHATRVSRYIDEEGQAEIEPFLDSCLSLENLIDVYAPYVTAKREDDNGDSGRRTPLRFEAKSYMDPFINPPEVMEAERLRIEEERRKAPRFPERPERDVLGFLMWNAPLKRWQRDLLAMIRNEAHYFAPQALTKVLNEGWACLGAHSRVFTDRGLIPIRELVEGRLPVNVSDGEQERSVYDWACFEDRETVCILTRRGFTVEGSVTHRVLLPDGTWRRLDELRVGDDVALGIGADLWPSSEVELRWEPRQGLTLAGVAAEAGVSVSTVARHKRGSHRSRKAAALEPLLGRYEAEPGPRCTDVLRKTLRVPRLVDERLAAFLGYQLSDGNISDVKRVVSFTTGDAELAELYTGLVRDLFGLEPRVQRDGRRLRVHAYSRHLIDFLVHLGCPTGRSAARKVPPEAVLRSPKRVVAAFLRAYFDGDGYAGDVGVILVSASER